MRIGTWNCHSGLGHKWDAVEALDLDVLTVQECGPRTEEQVRSHTRWSAVWQQGTYRNGVAVLARSPFSLQIDRDSEPFFISTLISGLERFRFVGVWTRTPTFLGDEYPRQTSRMIEQLLGDRIPTVIAGDFNASSRNLNHLENVERLAAFGLVSAYHSFHGIDHTEDWEHATSYHLWQESNRHHMDYVFVPAEWPIQSVEVGTFDAYSRSGGLSDHVPVVVTIGHM